MDMTGQFRIPATREKVWLALNDPEILRQSLSGCEQITKLSDTEMTARMTAKVGPVKATFSGKVTFSEIDPPNGYVITGEGTGGPAGFAKGGATVKLVPEGTETVLSYVAYANVSGKLAQIGSRMLEGTARKMADDFFGRFAKIVGQNETAVPEQPAGAAAEGGIDQCDPIPKTEAWAGRTAEPAIPFAAIAPESAGKKELAQPVASPQWPADIERGKTRLSSLVWAAAILVIAAAVLVIAAAALVVAITLLFYMQSIRGH